VRHPLTDAYASERATLIELGRSLTEAEGAVMSDACPAWSIKDIYAHLAGISADILAGNTEGAATEPWADAQVAARAERSLREVLDEWETAGTEVSSVMEVAGDAFPFQLFIDQWTHGWDIRAALGDRAAATADMSSWEHFLDVLFGTSEEQIDDDLSALTVTVGAASFTLGSGASVGELQLDLFEYARIAMGRRSAAQLAALPWPCGVAETQPYIDELVFWSVNGNDVVEPVLAS